MSLSLVVHDSLSLSSKKRSSVLTRSRHSDLAPIPPTLVNSPYLSSPHSVFRRKTSVPRWPSQREDEWLRDMVPIDGSLPLDVDTRSETSSNDSTTPSPTSESSFGSLLFPPSPMLRPCSIGPDVPTPARRALGDTGVQSPHN